jgi:uncharacterized membrane protein YbhN (UPF0104 family)
MTRSRATFVLAAIGIFLFVLLAREVNWGVFVPRIAHINFWLVGGAFLFYVATNILRSCRFSLLLGGRVTVRSLFFIVARQNFWNTVTPFRLGEFSYLYEVGGGAGGGRSLSSLVAVRVLDVAAVAVLFLLGLLLVPETLASRAALALLGIAAVAVSFGILAALLFFGGRTAAGGWIIRLLPERLRPLAETRLSEAAAGFAELRSRRILFRAAFLSVMSWGLTFIGGVFLLSAAGAAPLLALGFVYAFPVFVSMTPLIAFGGFGSFEASVVLPLALLGVPVAEGTIIGIIVHVAELLFLAALALASVCEGGMSRFTRRMPPDNNSAA